MIKIVKRVVLNINNFICVKLDILLLTSCTQLLGVRLVFWHIWRTLSASFGLDLHTNVILIQSWLMESTSVMVPRKAAIELCLAKMFFLCKNAFKWAIVQLSNQSGSIFRVRLKITLNHHWNLFFYYANFVSLIQIYGNFKVILKMVPDWFENCALAHLKAFLQRKNIFARQSTILAFLGTLTDVMSGLPSNTVSGILRGFLLVLPIKHRMHRWPIGLVSWTADFRWYDSIH